LGFGESIDAVPQSISFVELRIDRCLASIDFIFDLSVYGFTDIDIAESAPD